MRPPHECGGKQRIGAVHHTRIVGLQRGPRTNAGENTVPSTWASRRSTRFNEAPARMRGKTGEPFRLAISGGGASMRPPHECGGKRSPTAASRLRWSRFNEAPARMRGKTSQIRSKCATSTSFNEAPARMRGKTPPASASRDNRTRFNEAPARMRGKTGVRPEAVRQSDAASMRPPHECGGKRPVLGRLRHGLQASMRPPHECGGKRGARRGALLRAPRFNEAPARMRGKTAQFPRPAQTPITLQ